VKENLQRLRVVQNVTADFYDKEFHDH
jgi:hypothetical protein